MFNASSLIELSILPAVVAAMILIGVKTNVVASVYTKFIGCVECRIMAKLIANQKKQILKLTSEYAAAVVESESNAAKYTAATKTVTDTVSRLEQAALIVPVDVPGMVRTNVISAIIAIHLVLRDAKIAEEDALQCSAASFRKMIDLKNKVNAVSVTAFDD